MSKAKKGLSNVDLSGLKDFATENFPQTQPQMAKEKNEKEVTITLRIPARIARNLKIKAVNADKTQREFILEGLKLMGVEIEDDDIRDRRKS